MSPPQETPNEIGNTASGSSTVLYRLHCMAPLTTYYLAAQFPGLLIEIRARKEETEATKQKLRAAVWASRTGLCALYFFSLRTLVNTGLADRRLRHNSQNYIVQLTFYEKHFRKNEKLIQEAL